MDACHQNDKQGVSQVPEIMRLEENTLLPNLPCISQEPLGIIIYWHPQFPIKHSIDQNKNPGQDDKVEKGDFWKRGQLFC